MVGCMTRIWPGRYTDKTHRRGSYGNLSDDGETISIQLCGPGGEFGINRQAQIKKGALSVKYTNSISDRNIATVLASNGPRNRVPLFPPKQNQCKSRRLQFSSATCHDREDECSGADRDVAPVKANAAASTNDKEPINSRANIGITVPVTLHVSKTSHLPLHVLLGRR